MVIAIFVLRFYLYLFLPQQTEAEWRTVASWCADRFNFSHCIGAIDGKRIQIVKLRSSEQEYSYNKKYLSVLLKAIVDTENIFMFLYVGAEGQAYDSTVFITCELMGLIETEHANLPP